MFLVNSEKEKWDNCFDCWYKHKSFVIIGGKLKLRWCLSKFRIDRKKCVSDRVVSRWNTVSIRSREENDFLLFLFFFDIFNQSPHVFHNIFQSERKSLAGLRFVFFFFCSISSSSSCISVCDAQYMCLSEYIRPLTHSQQQFQFQLKIKKSEEETLFHRFEDKTRWIKNPSMS